MTDRTFLRALMISTALAAGLVLAGCNSNGLSPSAKASKPIPEKLLSEIESKNMDKSSPMLVRLFKQEAELEVWKQDRTGHFALLKTYPICRWSGDLGPKIREGDRQAPEGFYSITPGQMNPASSYYLSFNMGYPNAYDKAWGRTGSQLMVHGDCSSRGCYAMTDEQISEIYSLGRESFFGGQGAFQVQAYPFRMTAQNMARHRDSPNMPFWKMIKEGNDYFEVTKREPKVDFCEKKYVFGAEKPADAQRPLSFNASAKCPTYEIPTDIADALKNKERNDQIKMAELISRGTPLAKSRAGVDGGMHPIFASKLPDAQSIVTSDANDYAIASYGPAPGTIPTHVDPPKAPEGAMPAAFVTSPEPVSPAPAKVTTASADANAGANASGGGFFSNLAAKVGLRGPDKPEARAAVKPAPRTAQKPKPAAKNATTGKAASASAPHVTPLERPKQALAQPQMQASAKTPFPDPAPKPAPAMTGAQPTLSSNSFDSRWSSFR